MLACRNAFAKSNKDIKDMVEEPEALHINYVTETA